jgi:hypothetical protein
MMASSETPFLPLPCVSNSELLVTVSFVTSSQFLRSIMTMTAPRHQSSLEGLIDFCMQQPTFADAAERARATARFQRIIGYLEEMDRPGEPYNRPALVRLTFEYARSPESQDRFLAFFFRSLAIGMLDDDPDDDDDETYADLCDLVFEVARFLMTNFFLPRRFSLIQQPLCLPPFAGPCRRRRNAKRLPCRRDARSFPTTPSPRLPSPARLLVFIALSTKSLEPG